MSTGPIRLFPDPVLRGKNAGIRVFDAKLRALARRMIRIMKAQPHGIGIAAPQIGVSLKAAVVDVSPRLPGARCLILINPVILASDRPILSREGCMSLPDYTARLKRFEWVRLRWQDEYGHFREGDFQGIEAVCIQHEVDHLNGMLFLDRVAVLKTDMLPRKVPKPK